MIKYYARVEQTYKNEKIASESYINWLYSSIIGKNLLELIIKRKFASWLFGIYCNLSFSKRGIESFIKDFNIDMSQFKKLPEEFSSFNDFFIRELNYGQRPFDPSPDILISPCDGKLTVYEDIMPDKLIQVKGFTYSLEKLIMDESLMEKYTGGTCLIFRLCPSDYHRFHFIDDGTISPIHNIKGFYYSVNPIALKRMPKIYCENKRAWSLFNSKNFGSVLYVEVGATFVGSIIQTNLKAICLKGEEKGYFKFGGSTVILFFEKNKIIMDEDLISQSGLGFEIALKLGERIGTLA